MIEQTKTLAIEANQTLLGPDPQIPVGSLSDCIDSAAGKSLLIGPLVVNVFVDCTIRVELSQRPCDLDDAGAYCSPDLSFQPRGILCRREHFTAQRVLESNDRDLDTLVSRCYLTALAFLSDAVAAEALVIGAVQNLDPENVTSHAIRGAVLERLVQVQMRWNMDLTPMVA